MSIIYKGQTIDTAGKDATINGVNNLTVEAGNGVDINQDGDILTINATISGGNSYALAITFDAAFPGQPYTVTATGESYSGTVPASLKELVTVLYGGTQYTVTSTSKNDGLEYSENVLTGSAFGQYSVTLRERAHIYGVTWDGTATTKWTRTDDAAGFTDPVPYVAGATEYGSPFDGLMPWKGMTVENHSKPGAVVAIPKFYYKLEQNTPNTPSSGLTIKIADKPVPGYYTSPAHMDRGDGKGERDVIYVGRYHCADDFKSKTGVLPKASMTRADFRTNIHALSSNVWQMDFATRFTIWLLYLVEFADWNSQACIGYGCGNNSSTGGMGYSDSMPYHTGTTQTIRTTYGLSTQYRNIEGLWDNVYDWVDGCYNDANGLNIILNPNNFSDTGGGKLVGLPVSGFPSEFTVSATGGFPMFYPTKTGGSENSFSCDYWYFVDVKPVVYAGGHYGHGGNRGVGCFYCTEVVTANASTGSRLMELPN